MGSRQFIKILTRIITIPKTQDHKTIFVEISELGFGSIMSFKNSFDAIQRYQFEQRLPQVCLECRTLNCSQTQIILATISPWKFHAKYVFCSSHFTRTMNESSAMLFRLNVNWVNIRQWMTIINSTNDVHDKPESNNNNNISINNFKLFYELGFSIA